MSTSKRWRKYSKQKVKEKRKKTKQSGERHQSAKSTQSKGSYQAANPSEEDANKKKNQKKNSPVCPLHGTGHDMNSCKVMLAQSKSIKSTWLTACGGGAGRVRFQANKKCPSEGKEDVPVSK